MLVVYIIDLVMHISMLVVDILMLKRVLRHNFDDKKGLDAIIMMLKRLCGAILMLKKASMLFSTKSSYSLTWCVCACAVDPLSLV